MSPSISDKSFTPVGCPTVVICGISTNFSVLSPRYRQVARALLTRPPLSLGASSQTPLDLHVLSTPPAFVLSQNQTLKFNDLKPRDKLSTALTNFACLAFCQLNDCFKVHISYFKDFDRNFQNNYYFVIFPSIQFLSYSHQQRLMCCPSF